MSEGSRRDHSEYRSQTTRQVTDDTQYNKSANIDAKIYVEIEIRSKCGIC